MKSYSRAITFPRPVFFAQRDEQEGNARDAHWIGKRPDFSPGGKGSGRFKYVELDNLKAGEVQNSQDLISPQLSAINPNETLVLRNKFYSIPLRLQSGGTPFIFGRLNNYHPVNNQEIRHAKSLQLIYFREYCEPAFVDVNYGDMNLKDGNAVQSACIKVEAWLHGDEIPSFDSNKQEFNSLGFDIRKNFDLGLLRSTLSISKERFPWIIMVSSKWISSHDALIQEGILLLLQAVVARNNRMIINYRPPGETLGLNNHWHLVPQVDDRTFYETSDIPGTARTLQVGFEKQLMPQSLKELVA